MWPEIGSFFRDLFDWFWAVLKQWIPLVTGGVITAALAIVDLRQGKPLTWAIGTWFLAAVFLAMFLAWRKFDRHAVGHINSIYNQYIQQDNSTNLVLIITVLNPGEPSIFHDWEPWITVDGRPMKGTFQAIPQNFVITTVPGQPSLTYQPEEALYERAIRHPVEHGGSVQGVMVARFLGVRDFDLSTIKVRFRDVHNRLFTTRRVVITSHEIRHSPGVGQLVAASQAPPLPPPGVTITPPNLPIQQGHAKQQQKRERRRRR